MPPEFPSSFPHGSLPPSPPSCPPSSPAGYQAAPPTMTPSYVPPPAPVVATARPLTGRGAALIIVAAFVLGAMSVGLGRAAIDAVSSASSSASSTSASAPLDLGQSPSSPSSSGPSPSTQTPSSQSPSTQSPSNRSSGRSGSSSADSAKVAAAVDPGVVDIESQLGGGIGAGTGMVLTDTGEILTNNHVVDGATRIVVTVVSSGKTYSARVVGTDPTHDVAVLAMQGASGLSTIPLGNSDDVKVGDAVAAIGNAGGQGGTPSLAVGQVVGLDQQITASDENGSAAETLTGMIQVDANVVPGDSGGPLANADGKVIGMDTAASASNGRSNSPRLGGASEGFAIPINRALSIAKTLASKGASRGSSGNRGSTGSTSGGFLGVQVESATSGATIVGVQTASPAEAAGLTAGDTIVRIDGTTVQSADDLVTALGQHQTGDHVSMRWITADGTQAHATLTLR